jgi:hypothetical protein
LEVRGERDYREKFLGLLSLSLSLPLSLSSIDNDDEEVSFN